MCLGLLSSCDRVILNGLKTNDWARQSLKMIETQNGEVAQDHITMDIGLFFLIISSL